MYPLYGETLKDAPVKDRPRLKAFKPSSPNQAQTETYRQSRTHFQDPYSLSPGKLVTMGLSSSRCAPTCFDGEHEFNLNDSRFIDVAFPPTPSSLGEAKPGKLFITQEQREKTRWVRVPELLHFNQQITAAEFSQKQQSELTWTGPSAR
eukprot:s6526_g1.t4